MGSMMYAGIAGMSVFLLWVASTTPQMMEHLVPTFHAEPIPIGGSSKFEKYLQKWELQIRYTLSARSGAQAIFKPSPTVLARHRFRSARRGISAPAFYEIWGFVSLNSVADHSFSRASISSRERLSPNLVEPLQASAFARSSPLRARAAPPRAPPQHRRPSPGPSRPAPPPPRTARTRSPECSAPPRSSTPRARDLRGASPPRGSAALRAFLP